jgi:hypothetical protein
MDSSPGLVPPKVSGAAMRAWDSKQPKTEVYNSHGLQASVPKAALPMRSLRFARQTRLRSRVALVSAREILQDKSAQQAATPGESESSGGTSNAAETKQRKTSRKQAQAPRGGMGRMDGWIRDRGRTHHLKV